LAGVGPGPRSGAPRWGPHVQLRHAWDIIDRFSFHYPGSRMIGPKIRTLHVSYLRNVLDQKSCNHWLFSPSTKCNKCSDTGRSTFFFLKKKRKENGPNRNRAFPIYRRTARTKEYTQLRCSGLINQSSGGRRSQTDEQNLMLIFLKGLM